MSQTVQSCKQFQCNVLNGLDWRWGLYGRFSIRWNVMSFWHFRGSDSYPWVCGFISLVFSVELHLSSVLKASLTHQCRRNVMNMESRVNLVQLLQQQLHFFIFFPHFFPLFAWSLLGSVMLIIAEHVTATSTEQRDWGVCSYFCNTHTHLMGHVYSLTCQTQVRWLR